MCISNAKEVRLLGAQVSGNETREEKGERLSGTERVILAGFQPEKVTQDFEHECDGIKSLVCEDNVFILK